MILTDFLMLAGAGIVGGFAAGLIGIGGGLIFAPVLFFYFSSTPIPPEFVAPLTIGTSLLGTTIVALVSAHGHLRRGAVDIALAWPVGLSSAIAVVLMTLFVTTQPWYGASIFRIAFAALLLVVVVRLIRPNSSGSDPGDDSKVPADSGIPSTIGPVASATTSFMPKFATGSAAGVIASAVGVGGGIVLVPVYSEVMGHDIKTAIGTSSATIVVISLAGVLANVLLGPGESLSPMALGFVEFAAGLSVSVPAAIAAPFGVRMAHSVNIVLLRRIFAVIALIVAIRMLVDSF